MKKLFLLTFFSVFFCTYSQSVTGKWKTIDDKTGDAKSVVEIFELNGKIYGKIIDIYNESKRNAKCEKCSGEDKNKQVLGLTIIKGLSKDGDEFSGGKITDPQTGSTYKCILKLKTKDKLEVRGYMGISIMGRSQFWVRQK